MPSMEEIRRAMTEAKERPKHKFLSTGCALLNLAISGFTDGGLLVGGYTFLVGDSSSGKSFTAMTCLAEAAHNEDFDNYEFIYDNAENGVLFDVGKYLGQKTAKRLKSPRYEKGEAKNSATVEEFYYNLKNALEAKKPCIYILDSMDALSSDADIEVFEKNREAHETDGKKAGSYGMSKAKLNSTSMPHIISLLEQTGSILIIICQTRDNVGFGFAEKTRAGGRALKFYAHVEVWTSVVETIRKNIEGKPRPIGIRVQAAIKKNRVNGWMGKVELPIYRSIGIDDLGAAVHWLIEEGHWKKPKKKDGADKGKEDKDSKAYVAHELGLQGSEDALIQAIQKKGLEPQLYKICQTFWTTLENSCKVERKPRYS